MGKELLVMQDSYVAHSSVVVIMSLYGRGGMNGSATGNEYAQNI